MEIAPLMFYKFSIKKTIILNLNLRMYTVVKTGKFIIFTDCVAVREYV